MKLLSQCLVFFLMAGNAVVSAAQESEAAPSTHDTLQLLQGLDDYPHAERVALSEKEVADHEVDVRFGQARLRFPQGADHGQIHRPVTSGKRPLNQFGVGFVVFGQ